MLEALMDLAQVTGSVRVRTGPRDEAMRRARVCYDHMAGETGVELFKAMVVQKHLSLPEGEIVVSNSGRLFFNGLGISVSALEQGRRPLCRTCLDWSERRHHLGGALGAALLDNFLERKWIRRMEGRVLAPTPTGRQALSRHFGLRA